MNRPKRILLINYEYPPIGGGAGTATAGMARALASMGHDVVVLTSRFGDQPRLQQSHGLTIRRVPVVRRRADRCTAFEMLTFMISASFEVLRFTEEWTPDVSIAFFGIPGGPVAWTLRLVRGVPYVVSLRGGDVPGFIWQPGAERYHRFTTPLIRFLWQRALAVVANGSGLQQLAEQAMPGLTVPIIPNGVDTDMHAPPVSRIDNAVPRLLLVGRLVHQKGIDVLFHALSHLRDLPFTVDIAGEGPERDTLCELATSKGLTDRVRFNGWVDRRELPSLYGSADIFVLPSRIEGMPNVVLEAMAYALPVVATDIAGTREVVRNEQTGLLVPVENVSALADAIRRLIANPQERRTLGDNARAFVVGHHSWTASARAYVDLAFAQQHAMAEVR